MSDDYPRGLRVDLVGQRFGLLEAIMYCPDFFKMGHGGWLCKCDCGEEKILLTGNLLSGSTTSCGCNKKNTQSKRAVARHSHKDSNYRAIRRLYSQYKRGAKHRKFSFEISLEEFDILIKKRCFYCDSDLSNYNGSRYNTNQIGIREWLIAYNGIDRIDNNKGYILENCITACADCNRAKWAHEQDKFFNWIKKVYEHQELDKWQPSI